MLEFCQQTGELVGALLELSGQPEAERQINIADYEIFRLILFKLGKDIAFHQTVDPEFTFGFGRYEELPELTLIPLDN